jgi:hypothetical protein
MKRRKEKKNKWKFKDWKLKEIVLLGRQVKDNLIKIKKKTLLKMILIHKDNSHTKK